MTVVDRREAIEIDEDDGETVRLEVRPIFQLVELCQQLATVRQLAERIGERNRTVFLAQALRFELAKAEIALRGNQFRKIEIITVGDDDHPPADKAQNNRFDNHAPTVHPRKIEDEDERTGKGDTKCPAPFLHAAVPACRLGSTTTRGSAPAPTRRWGRRASGTGNPSKKVEHGRCGVRHQDDVKSGHLVCTGAELGLRKARIFRVEREEL